MSVLLSVPLENNRRTLSDKKEGNNLQGNYQLGQL